MMSKNLPLMDSLIEELKKLSKTSIIKYDKSHFRHETIDTMKNFDYYHLASIKEDSFESYPRFSKEAIEMAGISDIETLIKYHEDKNTMPISLRGVVLLNQRYITIRDFEEQNDYYRQYLGLPNLDDIDLIYVPKEAFNLGLPLDVPIHRLTEGQQIKFKQSKFYTKILSDNPDKNYLKFIGEDRIDLYMMRKSKNFSIIKIDKSKANDKIYDAFLTAYEQIREYFMVAIYINEYSSMYKMYDEIIAFIIMVTALQRVITNTFKTAISRDFFDLQSIIAMFNAYGIPFVEELPIEQHRLILKNLNNLFRLKSTDRVIVEIASLLGFSGIRMYKYYMVKEHKKDLNGDPIFIQKDDLDNDGNVIGQSLDNENMFDVYFNKVDLDEQNIPMAITNSQNDVSYGELTIKDPYWWEDDSLRDSIYNNEFNFLETKYIGFDVIYKMSAMMFEYIYFLSMIHDKKSETETIYIYLPKIFSDTKISLFDTIILLFALTCKRQHMKGEILYEPSKIGYVLGFNFGKDLSEIIDSIKYDKRMDDELITYLKDIDLYSYDDIDHLYCNIEGFKKCIEKNLLETNDIDVYRKYKDIYNTLMTTSYMSEIFETAEGERPKTYLEYLEKSNNEIFSYVTNIREKDIDPDINHILSKLQELCESVEYLHLAGNGINININALKVLVNFFRSYTIDLSNINLMYYIDDKMDNLLKLIDESIIHSKLYVNDDNTYLDDLTYTANLHMDSKMEYIVQTRYNVYFMLDDKMYYYNKMEDRIGGINTTITLNEANILKMDSFDHLKIFIGHRETLSVKDRILHTNLIEYRMKILLTDKMNAFETKIQDMSKLNVNDDIIYKITSHYNDIVTLLDSFSLNIHLTLLEENLFKNDLSLLKSILSVYTESIYKIDLLQIMIKHSHDENIVLSDSLEEFIVSSTVESIYKILDNISTKNNLSVDHLLNIEDKDHISVKEYIKSAIKNNEFIDSIINTIIESDNIIFKDNCIINTLLSTFSELSYSLDTIRFNIDIKVPSDHIKLSDSYSIVYS